MFFWNSLVFSIIQQMLAREMQIKGTIRYHLTPIRMVIIKKIYLCINNYTKAFHCVALNKLWKALKEMGIPNHLTHLLRNLYMSQEATVRTLYGKTDWFQD